MIQLILSHWVFFVIAAINRSFDLFLWAHESLLLVNAGFLLGASHFKDSFWGQFDFFLILKLVCRLPLLSRGLLTFPQIFIKYLQGTRCSATCWIEWGIKLGFWPQLAYFLVDGRQESQPCITGINSTWSWYIIFLCIVGYGLLIFCRGIFHICLWDI